MTTLVERLRQRPVVAIAVMASALAAAAVIFGLQSSGPAGGPDQQVSDSGHFMPTIVVDPH